MWDELHFALALIGLILMLTALVLSFDKAKRPLASHLITGAGVAVLGAVVVQLVR